MSTSNNKLDDEITIGIALHEELFDSQIGKMESIWFLYVFPKSHKIKSIIKSAQNKWNLDASKQYSLIMIDDISKHYRFVTDESRSLFAPGALFHIYFSVGHVVSRVLEEFKQFDQSNFDRLPLFKRLFFHSTDSVFVTEFDQQNGFQTLVSLFVNKKFSDQEMGYVLDIFAKMLEHDIIRWSNIDKKFFDQVVQLILNSKFMTLNNASLATTTDDDRKVLIYCLNILESALVNCAKQFLSLINDQIPISRLRQLLECDNESFDIQQNVLALINCIMQNTQPNERKIVFEKFREPLMRCVINKSESNDNNSRYGSELTHQLYVLQTHLLRVYEEDLYGAVDRNEAETKWKEIRRNFDQSFDSKFEMDHILNYHSFNHRSSNLLRSNSVSSNQSSSVVLANAHFDSNNSVDEFERFGFPNQIHPFEIFAEPPGALLLNMLWYYSSRHTDQFVQFVVANAKVSNDPRFDCPLIVAALRVTALICDLLGLDKPPREEGKEFYPMLLEHDEPLQEFFSIGMSLFNKTWHELNATPSDIDILCDFLCEKFRKILAKPYAISTFKNFRKELMKISYNEIALRWKEERVKRDKEKEDLPAIRELKLLLAPQLIDIIRQNRLNYLIRGTRFDKYTPKGQRLKDKFWFCQLSSNHKMFLYSDCEEDCRCIDTKTNFNKLNINDIQSLVVGKDCPHMRDSRNKKSTISLAFSLLTRDESIPSLHFMAPKSDVYDYWVDGVNALLDQEMISAEAKKDEKMLLDLEIKLRLLDIEGLNIPDIAPELPPLPTNYEFASGHNKILSQI